MAKTLRHDRRSKRNLTYYTSEAGSLSMFVHPDGTTSTSFHAEIERGGEEVHATGFEKDDDTGAFISIAASVRAYGKSRAADDISLKVTPAQAEKLIADLQKAILVATGAEVPF